jgi:hypothetical protein
MLPDLPNLSAFLSLYLLAKSVLLAKSMLLAKPFVGMPLATAFFKSNFVTAKSLEPGVIYRGRIVSVGPHTFENGETALVIRLDYLGKAIAMNRTRLEAMIEGLGVDYDAWVGHEITFSQGNTFYQGKPEKCVAVKPVVATRIESKLQARPALGPSTGSGPQRNVIDIRSGAGGWDDGEPPARDPSDPGPGEADGIPF